MIEKYALEQLRDGDWLFMTEKMVAGSQGRAYPVAETKARPLAVWLSKRVVRTSTGIGLGIPETMEWAIREVGTPRILLAAAVSVVSKRLFGRTGDFYRVTGPKARGIDGPGYPTIPPYDEMVVLTAAKPTPTSEQVRDAVAGWGKNVEVFLVDINDLGGNVLGSTTDKKTESLVARILRDNPIGQGHESTPLGIIRRVCIDDPQSCTCGRTAGVICHCAQIPRGMRVDARARISSPIVAAHVAHSSAVGSP